MRCLCKDLIKLGTSCTSSWGSALLSHSFPVQSNRWWLYLIVVVVPCTTGLVLSPIEQLLVSKQQLIGLSQLNRKEAPGWNSE